MNSILVVDDDLNLQKYVKEFLSENNYIVTPATGGITALELVDKTRPDLVVLDLSLPDIKGESVFMEIKKKYPDLPIIILTGTGKTQDMVNLLNLGADDYISKPFVADEFLARIKARLRKEPLGDLDILQIHDLILNKKSFAVTRAGKLIVLTPKEFKLLEYLMMNKNQVLSRDMILNRVWSFTANIQTRIVDVCISSLRKKVDGNSKKKLIQSTRGFGYMVKE